MIRWTLVVPLVLALAACTPALPPVNAPEPVKSDYVQCSERITRAYPNGGGTVSINSMILKFCGYPQGGGPQR